MKSAKWVMCSTVTKYTTHVSKTIAEQPQPPDVVSNVSAGAPLYFPIDQVTFGLVLLIITITAGEMA